VVKRVFVSIVAASLVVLSCGGGAAPAPTSSAPASVAASGSPKPEVVAFRAAYSNLTADNLSQWYAKDKGIFAENSLDVTLIAVDGGSRTMATLVSGDVKIAQLGGSECMSAQAGGADLVITAVLAPVYPYHFMAAASIKTPADLRGKKVGISSAGGSADIATRKVLAKFNLDPDKDVTLVSLGSHEQRTAALLAGSIQAAVDDPPNLTKLRDAGFHSLYDLAGEKLATANTTIVAQKAWVTANRSAMQRYVDSIVTSVARMKKDRAGTIDVLKKYFGATADRGYDEAYDFYLTQVTPALPFPKPELFADAQATLSKTNPKVKDLDVKTILDASFVQSAADRGLDKK
jgi:NitT/TauT family transport system substrate-binding protein